MFVTEFRMQTAWSARRQGVSRLCTVVVTWSVWSRGTTWFTLGHVQWQTSSYCKSVRVHVPVIMCEWLKLKPFRQLNCYGCHHGVLVQLVWVKRIMQPKVSQLRCMLHDINPLTAMMDFPTPGVFWSKSNIFNYIRQRQNIPVARYQYSLGIYRQIYPAAGIRNIPAVPDISGTWRLRG